MHTTYYVGYHAAAMIVALCSYPGSCTSALVQHLRPRPASTHSSSTSALVQHLGTRAAPPHSCSIYALTQNLRTHPEPPHSCSISACTQHLRTRPASDAVGVSSTATHALLSHIQKLSESCVSYSCTSRAKSNNNPVPCPTWYTGSRGWQKSACVSPGGLSPVAHRVGGILHHNGCLIEDEGQVTASCSAALSPFLPAR